MKEEPLLGKDQGKEDDEPHRCESMVKRPGEGERKSEVRVDSDNLGRARGIGWGTDLGGKREGAK